MPPGHVTGREHVTPGSTHVTEHEKDSRARIYRPENKPKTLVFSHTKRAFWACFRENWVYNFGHRSIFIGKDRYLGEITKGLSPYLCSLT
jgi:hypothetical protein